MRSKPKPEYDLSSTATPIEGKSDEGKKVLVTSVGGALIKEPGTVVYGPYTFSYSLQSSTDVNGKRYKEGKLHLTKFISQSYWCIKLERWKYDKYLSFVNEELKFV